MAAPEPPPWRRPLGPALAALILVSAGAMWYVWYGPGLMVRTAGHVPGWLYPPLLASAHVVTFALWTPAFVTCWRRWTDRRWGVAPVVLPLAAAVIAELAQFWLPRHDPDLAGAVASLAGVGLGLLAMAWVGRGRRPTGHDVERAAVPAPAVQGEA